MSFSQISGTASLSTRRRFNTLTFYWAVNLLLFPAMVLPPCLYNYPRRGVLHLQLKQDSSPNRRSSAEELAQLLDQEEEGQGPEGEGEEGGEDAGGVEPPLAEGNGGGGHFFRE